MRGRKPKERKSYVLRGNDGTLVEVTREVYLEWYQSRRRERYQDEKKKKYGVCSLDGMEEKGCCSYEPEVSLEQTAIRNIFVEKIRMALDELPEDEAYLIYLLFFEEISVKEAAQICGCSRKTVQNRRRRILSKLRLMMESFGMEGDSL